MLARSTSLLLLIIGTLTLPAGASSLTNEIRALLRTTDMGSTRHAISVREAGTSRILVDIDGNRSMIPASNMKVLTTGAALHLLGPEFRFTTQVVADGTRLIIIGDGDAGLGDPELLRRMGDETTGGIDVEDLLSIWVDAIVRSGQTEFTEIIVDDRIFDREFVHPSWPENQLNRAYCAQVAGVNFHLNVLHFFPEPAPPGRPVIGESVPAAPWLRPANNATSITGASGSNTAWVGRRLGTNRLTLYGNVRHAYRVAVPVTIHDPPHFFGELLAHRLRQRGLRIAEGAVRTASDEDPNFDKLPLIAPPIVTPIAIAAQRANTDSQNLHAEALIKRIGHERTGRPGSWSDGGAMVRLAVHERLADPALLETLIVADGSGLSRENRVAPALLTRWIDSLISDDQTAEIFLDSLAEGGAGTLRDRMRRPGLREAFVQAKSGYIRGVSCLSGVVTVAGERRVFSIMFNSMNASNSRAKDLQDRIVELIVADMINAASPLGSD